MSPISWIKKVIVVFSLVSFIAAGVNILGTSNIAALAEAADIFLEINEPTEIVSYSNSANLLTQK